MSWDGRMRFDAGVVDGLDGVESGGDRAPRGVDWLRPRNHGFPRTSKIAVQQRATTSTVECEEGLLQRIAGMEKVGKGRPPE